MSGKIKAIVAWAAAAVVIAGGAALLGDGDRSERVHVVNGLDEAVAVRFGETTVKLSPGEHTAAVLTAGPMAVEVRGADGRLLDRHPWDLDVETSPLVYNVLGAAPLYSTAVVYHAPRANPEAEPPQRPRFTVLAGDRWQRVSADYLFTDPPRSISVKGTGDVTRTFVGVLDGGWKTSLHATAQELGAARAAVLGRRLQRALPREWLPLVFAVHGGAGGETPDEVTADSAARAPELAWVHRAHIGALRRAGRLDEARATYRALAASAPGSAVAAASLLRVLPRAEIDAAAAGALAAHPSDGEVLAAAAYASLAAGRCPEAAARYGRIPLAAPEDNGFVEDQVRALLCAGHPDQAAAAALAAARVKGAGYREIALYAQTARVRGAAPPLAPEDLLKEAVPEEHTAAAWVRASLGDLPAGEPQPEAGSREERLLEIIRAATRDPERALRLCSGLDAAALQGLPDEVQHLLALEAYRTGEGVLFELLRGWLPFGPLEVAAWVDRGVEPEEWWRLADGERPAFALARVRRLQAVGQPVPAALVAALRTDPLRGPATLAAERWPRPKRQEPPVFLLHVP